MALFSDPAPLYSAEWQAHFSDNSEKIFFFRLLDILDFYTRSVLIVCTFLAFFYYSFDICAVFLAFYYSSDVCAVFLAFYYSSDVCAVFLALYYSSDICAVFLAFYYISDI